MAERPLRTVEFERIVSAPEEQPGNEPEPGCQFAAFRIPGARIELPKGVKQLIGRSEDGYLHSVKARLTACLPKVIVSMGAPVQVHRLPMKIDTLV